jgi:hypothetical protein
MPWWFYWPSLLLAVLVLAGFAIVSPFVQGVLAGLVLAAILFRACYGFWFGSSGPQAGMVDRLVADPRFSSLDRIRRDR